MLAKTVYYERRVEHNYWKKTVVSTGCGLFVVVCLFFGLLFFCCFFGGGWGGGSVLLTKSPLTSVLTHFIDTQLILNCLVYCIDTQLTLNYFVSFR